jgi:hypothetical protein
MKTDTHFQRWTTPFVNLETTLLLFATFIFHRYYFGGSHSGGAHTSIHNFLAVASSYALILPVYGGLILLFSLFKLPEDWQPFAAMMTFIGSTLITLTYTAMDWLNLFTPGWMELLLQWYYLLQAVISALQFILFLTQKPDTPSRINPQLTRIPTFFKSLLILIYVISFTMFLDRQRALAPDAITSQVNFWGVLITQGGYFLKRRKQKQAL